jgi:hypothetical protein
MICECSNKSRLYSEGNYEMEFCLLPFSLEHSSPRLLSKHVKLLPVVLYGFESWSLALREEHRLRVFENRVLRR